MNMPKFKQLQMFASELIILLDKGKNENILDICEYVEKGEIVEYINKNYSFQNREVNLNSIKDVNDILKKFYVSETEASNRGINSNGIAFLVQLIQEIYSDCMYNMKMNDIEPDIYSDYFN